MQRILNEKLCTVRSKIQQFVEDILSRFNRLVAVINVNDESTESKKAFYFISLMLLVFVVFLAPDKIAQTLTPTQMDIGIFEKAQEITKIIKKFLFNSS